MSEINVDELAAELGQRVKAQVESQLDGAATKTEMDALRADLESKLPTDSQLKDAVKAFLDDDTETQAIVQKLRHGRGDEKLYGSKFGRLGMSVADVEYLHDLLDAGKAGGRSGGPSEELANAKRAVSESYSVPTNIAKSDDERRIDEMHRTGILDDAGYRRASAAIQQVYGAMDTAESGYGSQLVGAQYVAELWRGARARSRVFSQIRQFDMTDPTAYLPVEADVPELTFVAENTANNSSNYTTVKTGSNRVQVDAKKFVIHQMWSGEMEEDSLVPFVPFLREQAARSLGHYSDSLVLNGDTTNAATGNINLDDADPADTKHYLAFDGIRHAGIVDNTGNASDIAGAITLNAFKASKGRLLDSTYLHDWGHPIDPNDLIYVGDPQSVDAVSFLDEVLTVDKYGPRATVLTGEQAKVLGHPLIASIAVSKTEADGKVSTTGSNNTLGQIVGFNRGGCVVGVRRMLKIEVERIPATDQSRIVYSTRLGFGRFTPTGAASGIEWADVMYDISL